MAASGVPVIWQVTLPVLVSVTLETLRLAGRSGLPPLVSMVQVVALSPVLLKTIAGLSNSPTTKVRAGAFASIGAMVGVGASITVIMTAAVEVPAVLVAVMV